LSGDSNAFIQIGSVFLIKVDGVIIVRNLSQRELAFIQRNSRILDSPREVLRVLEELAKSETTSEGAEAAAEVMRAKSTVSHSSSAHRLTGGSQATG
jgi:hypothetical protein